MQEWSLRDGFRRTRAFFGAERQEEAYSVCERGEYTMHSAQVKAKAASSHGPVRANRYRRLTPYLFLIPVFASMGLFKYYPLAAALVKSLYEWNGANIDVFVGLRNYAVLLADGTFYISLRNMVAFTIGYAAIQLTVAADWGAARLSPAQQPVEEDRAGGFSAANGGPRGHRISLVALDVRFGRGHQ
ncbi:hypothetical protein LJK87_05225 [Paenibacillus sp. P25]|nr:hypothetical protein LJK87_05225 [Paenibacillus sp. P25]